MTIAITGASGSLGRSTAELVLQQHDPSQVVLTSRTPESLDALAARGADVRHADFTDPASLRTALRGVDRLLLVSTNAVGSRVSQHHAAIDAAVEAGVQHVVYTSVPEPVPSNPALVVPDHAETEAKLRASGLRWTMLRNNFYSHLQAAEVEVAIRTGTYVTNVGTGRTAYVTREDCAAVAAAVLTQPGHEDTVYDVTGPQALSAAEIVSAARTISGKDVELVHVSDDELAAGLRRNGLPPEIADLVTSLGAASRAGFLSTVTSVVADTTGREPTTMQRALQAALNVH